jgi:TfoX/Sxy family transcriptional regulator of competence genes
MAFDDLLAARIRSLVARRKGFPEKKMFGGIGFLLNGNMCFGVWKEFLILRLGPAKYEETLDEPHVKEFDITGKSMRGWVMVESTGVEHDALLKSWVQLAVSFVRGLPIKE